MNWIRFVLYFSAPLQFFFGTLLVVGEVVPSVSFGVATHSNVALVTTILSLGIIAMYAYLYRTRGISMYLSVTAAMMWYTMAAGGYLSILHWPAMNTYGRHGIVAVCVLAGLLIAVDALWSIGNERRA